MALTPRETRELHALIDRRRTELLAELHDDAERVRRDRHEDLAGAAPDPADESVATLIADLDHAEVERDLVELRALDAARNRLAEGSYGVCADCGADIGPERLRVNPSALRCIRCQTAYEKTHGARPGSSL